MYLNKKQYESLSEIERKDYQKMSNEEKQYFTEFFVASEENKEIVSEEKSNPENTGTAKDKTGTEATNETGGKESANVSQANETGEEAKTENRGRHKKDCQCEKCKGKREAESVKPPVIPQPLIKTAEQQLKDDLGQYAPVANPTMTGQPNVSAIAPIAPKLDITKFISGSLFLLALDAAFPPIVKYGFGFFNPAYRNIKHDSLEKLTLTKTERELLEPSAAELVKYIFANANPVVIFLMCAGALYGSKLMMLSEEDFDLPKRKPDVETVKNVVYTKNKKK